MGIFGWSYPPGCSSVPGDEPCPPCALCGKDPEGDGDKGCSCDPCPACIHCGKPSPHCSCSDYEPCEQVGCLKHLSLGNLLTQIEIKGSQLHDLESEYKRRQKEHAIHCPGCNKELLPDFEGPYWCTDCKKEVYENGQFLES